MLTERTLPSCSATKTRPKVRRPKNKERPLEVQVAALSEMLGQTPLLMKSSNTMAAREFIPEDTVLGRTEE